MTRRLTLAGVLTLLVAAAPALAHEEAKTKIDPSMLLDITSPKVPQAGRAQDEAIKVPGPTPANAAQEWKQQPDGSYRYGNTTIVIRQDCPPGTHHYEPPPLPGRRSRP
jgi:hypothetical protein